MRLTFLIITICAFITLGAADKQKPNVLFISIDDMNHWVSCMREYQDIFNYPAYKTPNLDKLSERGMFFTNAHVPASSCKPSRVATFTGVATSRNGVYRNPHEWIMSPYFKGRDDVSLMQRFRKEGYWVAGGGKNFHGWHEPSWDEYESKNAPQSDEEKAHIKALKNVWGDAMKKMYKERELAKGDKAQRAAMMINGKDKSNAVVWGKIDVEDKHMGDSMMIDYIIKQLMKKHDKPFYLGAGFHKPHMPWSVPLKYYDMYPLDEIPYPTVKKGDLDDLPKMGVNTAGGPTHAYMLKSGKWKEAIQAYLATCTYVDGQLGRLMEAFDNSPNKDNTIIVLWADHGWHLGDKSHWKKFTVWEETTHIPMMIIAPGVSKPGQKCHRVVSSIDLYPTLLELCGFEPSKRLDGHSLVPLLKNPKREWDYPVLTTHSRGINAIRTEKWRYIQYPNAGEEELYDRSNDPLEHNNLASNPEYDTVKAELAAFMPKESAPEVVQVNNIVRDVMVEMYGAKIKGPTYGKARDAGYLAALNSPPGQEAEAATAAVTTVYQTALDKKEIILPNIPLAKKQKGVKQVGNKVVIATPDSKLNRSIEPVEQASYGSTSEAKKTKPAKSPKKIAKQKAKAAEEGK